MRKSVIWHMQKHIFVYLFFQFVIFTYSFSQEQNHISSETRNALYLRCIESIEKGDSDGIKLSFNQMAKTFESEYDKTKMKKLPGLFFRAGEIMSSLNDKKSTIDFYWNASLLYEEFYGPKNIFIPSTIKRIGNYLLSLNDYANAIPYYRAAIDPRLYFTDNHLALCKIRIGLCYSQLTYYQAAENIYSEVLELYLGFQDIDSIAIGSTYNNLASVNAKSQNLDHAFSYYRTALLYYQTNHDKENLNQAYIYNNLGNLLLKGKDYSGALAFYQKGLQIRLAAVPKKSIELTQSYYNIGYCYSYLGSLDSALMYCQRSIVSNVLEYNDLNMESNPTSFHCLSQYDLLTSLLDKGEYLIKSYQINSVVHEDKLLKAKAALTVGEELFYKVESNILNFKSKLAWSSRNNRLSKLLILVEYLLDTPESRFALLAEADYKRNFSYKSYAQINEAIAGKYSEYTLIEQNRQTSYLKDSGLDFEVPSIQLLDYLQFDTIMPRQHFEKIDKSSIAIIQSKLKPSQAIMSFVICDSLLIRHVISKENIDFKSIELTDLAGLTSKHLVNIKTYGDYTSTGISLYNGLFEDIEVLLEPFEELIIVPDEFLFSLPFETLIVDDHFLIDRFEISYSFSISKFLDNSKATHNNFNFVAFSPMGLQLISSESDDTIAYRSLNVNRILDYADHEVNDISNLFDMHGLKSIKHMGRDATISQLLEVRDASAFIHIATHNTVNLRNPWMSYIHFYPDSSFSNGKLYLPVIYSLGTNATCLILSGCGTGIGKINNNDGALSVAHAFSCNPIENLVLSLWNIDDKTTSEFMADLYSEILKGRSIGASLRSVKKEHINGDLKHPFFWSSILHYYNSL